MKFLLNRRNMMAKKNPVIYQLVNHYCDGTAATCINTGILMLSESFVSQHPRFQIELSATPGTNTEKAHVIRCNRIDSPYYGFFVRLRQGSNIYAAKYNGGIEYYLNFSDSALDDGVIIRFDFVNDRMSVYTSDQSLIGSIGLLYTDKFNQIPFTIGGSLSNGVDVSGGWKETWKGTIKNLVIREY